MRFAALGLLLLIPFTASAQDPPVSESTGRSRDKALVAPLAPPVAEGARDLSINSWEEIQVDALQKLLQDFLDDPGYAAGKALRDALKTPNPKVTVRKNYPPLPNPDGLPEPYLSISFDVAANLIGDPEVEKLATKFVNDVLSQNYFSQNFVRNLPADERTGDGWIKPAYLKVWVGPEDRRGNPFETPRDLSMPWRVLAHRLGYLPSPDSTLSIAFTPDVCQRMAVKAVGAGLYDDAIALANHGLRHSPLVEPGFLYIRAYCQIRLGNGGTATETIRELKATQRFPYVLRERLNGPTAVYLWEAHESLP